MTWKLLLVAAVLGCAGCIDDKAPRAYACSADSGVALSEQCPGDGFICGLEGTCRDPLVAGAFLCARDAGTSYCANGWFCTVEGRCRSRDAGGEFPCSRTDPAGDPKDGGAPNDCGNAQWWCGAAGMCQRLGVERAYRCAVDNDCEGAWRCSPEGSCVAPSADGLNGARFGSLTPPQLTSPLLSAAGATHLAIGTPFNNALPDGGASALPIVVAFADGGISAFLRGYPRSLGDNGVIDIGTLQVARSSAPVLSIRDLAFAETRAYTLRDVSGAGLFSFEYANTLPTASGPMLGAMTKIVDVPASALLSIDGGGVLPLPTTLRMSNRAGGTVVALSRFGLYSHEPSSAPPYDFTPLPGGGFANGVIGLDLAWLPVNDSDGGLSVAVEGTFLLATLKGVFLIPEELPAKLSTSSWYGVGGAGLPNALCPDTAGAKQRASAAFAVRTLGHNLFAALILTSRPDGSADVVLSLYALTLNQTHNALGSSAEFPVVFADGGCAGGANNALALVGPCEPCPPSFPRLVDFRPSFTGSDAGFLGRLESRCEQPQADGGRGPQRSYALDNPSGIGSGTCTRSLLRIEPDEARFITQAANTQKLARAETTRGNLFVGEFEENLAPLFMDAPPVMIIEDREDGGTLLAGADFLALETPDVGLLSVPYSLDEDTGRSSSVDGYPSWMAALSGVYELSSLRPVSEDGGVRRPAGRLIAYGNTQATSNTAPTRAVVLHTADGGRELTVSAFDSIYSADVTQVVDEGTGENALELRSIPFARSPILSLAAGTPAADEGLWALSYAHTQNGVFEVRAETRTRWRTHDVILPEDVVQVFATGQQARAGLLSGRVAALPSRLIISEPLSAEAQPAVSYAGVCGQPWVLAAGGLFKLAVAPGAAVGTWTRVPLMPDAERSQLAVSTPSDLYARGALHFHGGRFFAFLADGTTYTAAVTCPNGP